MSTNTRAIACARLFFFFQAEDGIRDLIVTGVQTCALPISLEDEHELRPLVSVQRKPCARLETDDLHFPAVGDRDVLHVDSRSEERRVGKECRSRWSPYH